jgi:hypothetical protein
MASKMRPNPAQTAEQSIKPAMITKFVCDPSARFLRNYLFLGASFSEFITVVDGRITF